MLVLNSEYFYSKLFVFDFFTFTLKIQRFLCNKSQKLVLNINLWEERLLLKWIYFRMQITTSAIKHK